MVELSIAVLRLPDGSVVLQRRTADARISPGKLGFFGGHGEVGENPLETLKRELKEETSLPVNTLSLRRIGDFQMKSDADEGMLHFTLYEVLLENAEFDVYEGQRAEVYTLEEALSRTDLTSSVEYALGKYWPTSG